MSSSIHNSRQFVVTLYRANGRIVRQRVKSSHYAAKKLANVWNDQHDATYYVEIKQKQVG